MYEKKSYRHNYKVINYEILKLWRANWKKGCFKHWKIKQIQILSCLTRLVNKTESFQTMK